MSLDSGLYFVFTEGPLVVVSWLVVELLIVRRPLMSLVSG